MFITGLGLGQ